MPSNHVGVSARRRLAAGTVGPVVGSAPGLAGITFLTPYRLAELLGAPALAAEERRPVTNPVLTVLMRQVLATEPGIFAGVATHPTTERRLIAAHRELSEVSASALDRVAQRSRRAADVVRIHRATRALLVPGWYEEQDLAAAAADRVAGADGPGDLGAIIVHLPNDLLASQARLLRTIAGQQRVEVIAATTGVASADALVHRSLQRLGHAAPVSPTPDGPAALLPSPVDPKVRVLSVSDADDEVRHAVRGIVDAAREGVALDRMAVITRGRPPLHPTHPRAPQRGRDRHERDGGLVARSQRGRTCSPPVPRALPAWPPPRGRLRPAGGSAHSLARAAGPGTGPGTHSPRQAGVVAGARDWAEAGPPRPRPRRRRRTVRRRRATDHRAARGEAPQSAGSRPGRPSPIWRTSSSGPRIDLPGGNEQLVAAPAAPSVPGAGPLVVARGTTTLPAERVADILDRLGSLDALGQATDRATFARTLALELDAGLGRIGRLGTGVLVGRASLAAGLDHDRVWILDAAEGTLPSRPPRGLAAARCRTSVGRRRVGPAHRPPGRGASSPAGHPRRHQLRRRPRHDHLAPGRPENDRRTGPVPLDRWGPGRRVASFTAGLRAHPFPATAQEYDCRILLEPGRDDEATTAVPAVARELVQARRSPAFTRFDGNLAGVDLPRLAESDAVLSATRLETWAAPTGTSAATSAGVEPAR